MLNDLTALWWIFRDALAANVRAITPAQWLVAFCFTASFCTTLIPLFMQVISWAMDYGRTDRPMTAKMKQERDYWRSLYQEEERAHRTTQARLAEVERQLAGTRAEVRAIAESVGRV